MRKGGAEAGWSLGGRLLGDVGVTNKSYQIKSKTVKSYIYNPNLQTSDSCGPRLATHHGDQVQTKVLGW